MSNKNYLPRFLLSFAEKEVFEELKTSKQGLTSERTNMAFAGATVMKGRGWGIAVCTGEDTQVGKISRDVTESASAKPPLVLRMEKFPTSRKRYSIL